MFFDGENVELLILGSFNNDPDSMKVAEYKAKKIIRLDNETFVTIDQDG